jgi:Tol biopolymer transport system component
MLTFLLAGSLMAAPVPKAGNTDGLIWVHRSKQRTLTAYAPDGKSAAEVKYADGEEFVGVAPTAGVPSGAVVWVYSAEKAKLLGRRTDGKTETEVSLKGVEPDRFIGIAPDGTKVAFVGNNPWRGSTRLPKIGVHGTLWVADLKTGATAKDTGFQQVVHNDAGGEENSLYWSPDGTRVMQVRFTGFNMKKQRETIHSLFDLATGKESPVEVPAGHEMWAWHPDGKSVITFDILEHDKRVLRVPTAGGKPVEVYNGRAVRLVAPSPDGSTLLCAGNEDTADGRPAWRAMALDLATGKKTRMHTFDEPGHVDGHWSPDGKRVVCQWTVCANWSPAPPRLVVITAFDRDGNNATTILKADGVDEADGVSLVGWLPTAKAVAPANRRKNAPVPKAEPREGGLLVGTSDGTLRVLTPDGKEVTKLDPKDGDGRLRFGRLSPDGKRVAAAHQTDTKPVVVTLSVRTLDTGEVKELHRMQHIDRLFWSADGATVYASGLDVEAGNDPNKKRHECWLNAAVDAKTGKAKPLEVGGEYRITGLTADGKGFVTLRTFGQRAVGGGVWGPEVETHLTDRTTLKHAKLIDDEVYVSPVATFPDGKRWLVQTEDGGPRPWLRVYHREEKSVSVLDGLDDQGMMHRTVCVSPDGKRVAFVRIAGPEGAKRWEVVAFDTDKKAEKVLHETKPPVAIPTLDWR